MSSDAAVSPEDQDILDQIGHAFLHIAAGIVAEGALWGVYLVLFVIAMRIQLSQPTRHALPVLVTTILLFVSSTTLWAMNIFDFVTRIKAYFIKLPDLSLSERLEIGDERALVVALPSETLFLLNMVIADAVVIWRAWVLWRGDRLQRLVYIPITFLFATFAYAIVSIQCLGQDLAYIKSTTNGTKACSWGPAISWAISMLTNITSTALIALKAWRIKEHIFSGQNVKEEQGVKVLLLLIESGFIYSLCWLTQLVVFFDFGGKEGVNILWTICNVFGDQISGLYPTVIIVLAGIQRSISDIEGDDDDDSRRLDLSTPSFSNIGTQPANAFERGLGVTNTYHDSIVHTS